MATASTTVFSGPNNQGTQVGSNFGHIGDIVHVSQPLPKPLPSFTVPFRRDPDFVERDIFAEVLRSAPNQALVRHSLDLVASVREKSPESWVFWVHASNPARFEEGYRKIAERVKPPGWDEPKSDILRIVSNWLSDESNGGWTLVVDNADDIKMFFPSSKSPSGNAESSSAQPNTLSTSQFLPISSNGSILITSRSRELVLRLTGYENDIISVEPMNEGHALALFRNKLGGGHDEQHVSELLKALDYMPLAISQAAAYIRQNAPRISISRYISNLHRGDKDRAALLEKDLGDSRRDQRASSSIIATWQISFEYIQEQRPSAAGLLSLMSFFDRQGIPESLLHDRKEEGDDEDGIDYEFEDDVSTLRSYSLIGVSLEGGMFEMHRLVQFSTRKWLDTKNEEEKWKEIFISKMYNAFPQESWDFENWGTCRVFFPHAELALAYRPMSPSYLIKWAEIMHRASRYACEQGKYSIAEKMVYEALKWRECALGPKYWDTLKVSNLMGSILSNQGKHEAAEGINRQSLDLRIEVLGEDHPYTLGEYEASEKMNRRALKGYEKILGKMHSCSLICMSNLASILIEQGKYQAAEEIGRQTLDARIKVLSESHPDTLRSMNRLASILQLQGKLEPAEDLCRGALAKQVKILGHDHPDTPASMNILALILRDQEKYDEAQAMIQRALEKRKEIVGQEHPSTLTAMHGMASILSCQERYDAAEKLYRQALEGRRKALGAQHPKTLESVRELASTLRAQGKHEEVDALESQTANMTD